MRSRTVEPFRPVRDAEEEDISICDRNSPDYRCQGPCGSRLRVQRFRVLVPGSPFWVLMENLEP
jgi:hypothetical protein